MLSLFGRGTLPTLLLGIALVLAGCSSKLAQRAPVEDRGIAGSQAGAPAAVEPSAIGQKPLPGSDNAGKPGYYTVKPGDTLIRIGLDTGQNWKDLTRWNGLENPNLIEVGQVLRVTPPVASAATNTAAVSKPVAIAAVTPTSVPPSQAASAATTGIAPAPAPAPLASGSAQNADEDIAWIWPARGSVLSGFDEVKNKGLDIAGAAGEPVVAAADGRVVYVGASLRGYGNLIILKHNNTYLTAYAHNQVLLVKEDQTVRRGQKIAEMGNSDADRVKLHFEVRRQGKPVDPAKYLPAR